MNNWFTVKVKYTKQLDNGSFKRVTEPYLVAAMTFTDAEARIYEELGNLIRGEFIVVSITRTELHDIFGYDDSEIWNLVTIKFESHDSDSEKAKKVVQKFLVTADSVKEATDRINTELKTMLVDFKVTSVRESDIVDVFPYASAE